MMPYILHWRITYTDPHAGLAALLAGLSLVGLCCALVVAHVTPRLHASTPRLLRRVLAGIAIGGVLLANASLVYAVGWF